MEISVHGVVSSPPGIVWNLEWPMHASQSEFCSALDPSKDHWECVATVLKICSFSGLRRSLLCSDRTFVQAWICTDDTWVLGCKQSIGDAISVQRLVRRLEAGVVIASTIWERFFRQLYVTWDVLITSILCAFALASWVATSHRGGALSSAK